MKTVRFLFNDNMARAIVQGRKTVTRRPVVCVGWDPRGPEYDGQVTVLTNSDPRIGTQAYFHTNGSEWHGVKTPCAPGDILIGRECWADVDGVAVYRADGARTLADWRSEYGKRCAFHGCKYCEDCFAPYMWESKPSVETWRPSIHMPDWAARIRRRVVSVTVERLQDITEDDAVREGFATSEELEEFFRNCAPPGSRMARPLDTFEVAWDGIYAAKGLGWDSNCWVWRIEFERENVQEVSNGR